MLAATTRRTGIRIRGPPLLLPGTRGRTLGSRRGRRRGRLRAETSERTWNPGANLRVHVRSAGGHDLHRDPVPTREPADVVVRARQIMRNNTLGPVDFGDDSARIRRNLLVDIEPVFRASNQRLTEV